MISLQSEVKRVYGAALNRVAVFVKPTIKAAYEAETKVLAALVPEAGPIDGRREFFEGITFKSVCAITETTAGQKSWFAKKATRRKQTA